MESLLQVLKRKSMLEEQFPILRSGFDDLDSSPSYSAAKNCFTLGGKTWHGPEHIGGANRCKCC